MAAEETSKQAATLRILLPLTPAIAAIVAALLVLPGQSASAAEPSNDRTNPNTMRLFDRSGSTQVNIPYTVPRFFRRGEIARYAQPTVNGKPAELWQCDEKNRWDDGSLKFAIVSLVVPQVPGHHPVEIGFLNSANRDNGGRGSAASGFLTKAEMLDPKYDFEATERLTGSVSHTISARTMLEAGKFRYWLQGPVLTAVIIEDRDGRSDDVNTDGGKGNPLHPIFETWSILKPTKWK